jgi:chemotaxis protein MotB
MRDPNTSEPPYASFVDLFTGVLLIFLIVIALLALKQNGGQISDIEQRGQFIDGLRGKLSRAGLEVNVDRDGGTLRIRESVLFESGEAELRGQSLEAVRALAEILRSELPCHVSGLPPTEDQCAGTETRFASVMIEGHTDSRPLSGNGEFSNNWELSAARAAETLLTLYKYEPALKSAEAGHKIGLRKREIAPLFAVAGYADSRPVSHRSLAKNRRIEIRFILDPEQASFPPPEPRQQPAEDDGLLGAIRSWFNNAND